jgi:hypothetical protein
MRILTGLDAASAYVGHLHTWASEVELEVTEIVATESRAVAAWTMTAIQSGPIPGGVPVATNRPVELRGITMIEVADGMIVRAADYIDTLGFVLQLGATLELPGGVRLSIDEIAVGHE